MTGDDWLVWLRRAVPRGHLRLKVGGGSIAVALLTSAPDPERTVEGGSWNRDAVVGARVANGIAQLRLLEIGHVTGNTLATQRLSWVTRVRLQALSLAHVTARALPIAEAANQWRAVNVTILL